MNKKCLSICSSIKLLKENDNDRFIGCDGKALSNELLEAQIKDAIEKEDYKYAHIIKKELERRKAK